MYAGYDPQQAARSLIERAAMKGLRLSNLTLQKLLYIAHGALLAIHHRPLVNEQFAAWRYGPVLENLYHDLKVYGADNITPGDRYIQHWGRIPDQDIEAISMIDSVLDHFGRWSGASLIQWSHKPDGPWHEVYSGFVSGTIPDEKIGQYFKNNVVKAG